MHNYYPCIGLKFPVNSSPCLFVSAFAVWVYKTVSSKVKLGKQWI